MVRNKLRTLRGLFAVLVLLFVFVWALLRVNAGWHFFAAQTIAEPLFEAGTGDVAVFESTESHLNIALKRFPNNPDYLDFAGRLKLLQTGQVGVMGAERRELLESAADNFRLALTTRPLWPYSWVNLLTAKDKLGQVDIEFNTALTRSAELGPWEPRVQLQVVDSGLRYWSRLGSAERALVQQKVLDALKVQPRNVFAIVKDYGRADLVCGEQGTYAQIRRWCEQVSPQQPNKDVTS
jgi:hypothetical protein